MAAVVLLLLLNHHLVCRLMMRPRQPGPTAAPLPRLRQAQPRTRAALPPHHPPGRPSRPPPTLHQASPSAAALFCHTFPRFIRYYIVHIGVLVALLCVGTRVFRVLFAPWPPPPPLPCTHDGSTNACLLNADSLHMLADKAHLAFDIPRLANTIDDADWIRTGELSRKMDPRRLDHLPQDLRDEWRSVSYHGIILLHRRFDGVWGDCRLRLLGTECHARRIREGNESLESSIDEETDQGDICRDISTADDPPYAFSAQLLWQTLRRAVGGPAAHVAQYLNLLDSSSNELLRCQHVDRSSLRHAISNLRLHLNRLDGFIKRELHRIDASLQPDSLSTSQRDHVKPPSAAQFKTLAQLSEVVGWTLILDLAIGYIDVRDQALAALVNIIDLHTRANHQKYANDQVPDPESVLDLVATLERNLHLFHTIPDRVAVEFAKQWKALQLESIEPSDSTGPLPPSTTASANHHHHSNSEQPTFWSCFLHSLTTYPDPSASSTACTVHPLTSHWNNHASALLIHQFDRALLHPRLGRGYHCLSSFNLRMPKHSPDAVDLPIVWCLSNQTAKPLGEKRAPELEWSHLEERREALKTGRESAEKMADGWVQREGLI